MLADIRFSSVIEPGLELVDILANAVRRAFVGNLRIEGWTDIRRLMIDRRGPYINLKVLAGLEFAIPPAYAAVLRHFTHNGKRMISPKYNRLAEEEAA